MRMGQGVRTGLGHGGITCVLQTLFSSLFFHLIMYSNLTTVEFCRPRSFCDLGQRSHISCLSIFSKGFFSETSWPISLKFHMQLSGKGRKEVYIFHLFYYMVNFVPKAFEWKSSLLIAF